MGGTKSVWMGWDTLVVVTHPLNRRAGSSERGQDRCGWFCRGRGWMDERDKVHGVPDEETMRLPVLPPPGGGGIGDLLQLVIQGFSLLA